MLRTAVLPYLDTGEWSEVSEQALVDEGNAAEITAWIRRRYGIEVRGLEAPYFTSAEAVARQFLRSVSHLLTLYPGLAEGIPRIIVGKDLLDWSRGYRSGVTPASSRLAPDERTFVREILGLLVGSAFEPIRSLLSNTMNREYRKFVEEQSAGLSFYHSPGFYSWVQERIGAPIMREGYLDPVSVLTAVVDQMSRRPEDAPELVVQLHALLGEAIPAAAAPLAVTAQPHAAERAREAADALVPRLTRAVAFGSLLAEVCPPWAAGLVTVTAPEWARVFTELGGRATPLQALFHRDGRIELSPELVPTVARAVALLAAAGVIPDPFPFRDTGVDRVDTVVGGTALAVLDEVMGDYPAGRRADARDHLAHALSEVGADAAVTFVRADGVLGIELSAAGRWWVYLSDQDGSTPRDSWSRTAPLHAGPGPQELRRAFPFGGLRGLLAPGLYTMPPAGDPLDESGPSDQPSAGSGVPEENNGGSVDPRIPLELDSRMGAVEAAARAARWTKKVVERQLRDEPDAVVSAVRSVWEQVLEAFRRGAAFVRVSSSVVRDDDRPIGVVTVADDLGEIGHTRYRVEEAPEPSTEPDPSGRATAPAGGTTGHFEELIRTYGNVFGRRSVESGSAYSHAWRLLRGMEKMRLFVESPDFAEAFARGIRADGLSASWRDQLYRSLFTRLVADLTDRSELDHLTRRALTDGTAVLQAVDEADAWALTQPGRSRVYFAGFHFYAGFVEITIGEDPDTAERIDIHEFKEIPVNRVGDSLRCAIGEYARAKRADSAEGRPVRRTLVLRQYPAGAGRPRRQIENRDNDLESSRSYYAGQELGAVRPEISYAEHTIADIEEPHSDPTLPEAQPEPADPAWEQALLGYPRLDGPVLQGVAAALLSYVRPPELGAPTISPTAGSTRRSPPVSAARGST